MPYLVIEIIISLAASYAVNGRFDYDYLTIFGLVNLILGILGLVIGAILSVAKEPNISKGLLISSALLLLMGFLTCSVFPAR